MAEIYNRVIETPGENTSDAIILQRIEPGTKVLECGCATGYMTKYMREKLGAKVWIVERNETAFAMAKEYAVDGVCADLEQPDTWVPYFKELKFDYILFADVLEHLRNPGEVLRIAADLLSEAGEVLVSIPNVAHADILINLYKNQWNYMRFGLLDDTHIHFWGAKNVRELFSLADLAPVLMDYSIIPPLRTEQANHDAVGQEEQAAIHAICQRYGSDIYQFVVAAKRAEYVLKHTIPCVDMYQQRHAAYGKTPDCCISYEATVRRETEEKNAAREQLGRLIRAHDELTRHHSFVVEGHEELIRNHNILIKSYDELSQNHDVLIRSYDELSRDHDVLVKKHGELSQNHDVLVRKHDELIGSYDALQKERDLFLERNNNLMLEQRSLEEQLRQSRYAYDVISNSFFWNLTKPFRRILDWLKYVFRNSKTAHLIWKGMKCLKQNGFVYTGRKFLAYLTGGAKEAQAVAMSATEATVFYHPGDPITILTTKHTKFIAMLVQNSLQKMGVSATIITEEPETYGEEVHIVICPQMFKRFPGRYISFQMEQTVSSRWLSEEYFSALCNSYAIFDYSLVNINYFKTHTEFGKMFYYLPVDHLPGMQRENGGYQYDVAFYGDVNNPRRRRILEELSKDFRVQIISEVFGEELYDELSKAKVIINIHYYENAMLETTRLYETLSLGRSIVVSERSSDPGEEERLEGIVDFVDVDDVEAIKKRIAHWLAHEQERAERVKKNNEVLNERTGAFDYFFYRFLLANDWLSFDRFYELAGDYVKFRSDRVCLSLPEAVDRRVAFDRDNQYGFEVFPGLRHTRGWTGCGLSYKFIMKKAQEQKFDRILVCEDDVFFPDDFDKRFDECLKYLNRHQDWDVFQGLMSDIGDVEIKRVDRDFGQTFAHLDHMISTVFNLYDKRIYPYIIAWDETNTDVNKNTIDRALEAKDLKVVATAPFLVGHKEDLSSTIWGFSNSQYNDLIAASSKKLENLVAQYEKALSKRNGNVHK